MKVYRLTWKWAAGEERTAIVVASNGVEAVKGWTKHEEAGGFDKIEVTGVAKIGDVDLLAD